MEVKEKVSEKESRFELFLLTRPTN